MPSLNPNAPGANSLSDPRSLPRWTSVNTTTEGPMFDGWFPGQAQFYTNYGTYGVAVDSNNTGGAYKTVLSIASGRGCVYQATSPAIATGGDTANWRFTVDSRSPIVISETLVTAEDRLHLGHITQATVFNANDLAGQNLAASMSAADTAYALGNPTTFRFLGFHMVEALGSSVLRFSSSLLVEVMLSASQTSTTRQARQCGVAYRLET